MCRLQTFKLEESKICQSFPKKQILESSKLKEFADDNFKISSNLKLQSVDSFSLEELKICRLGNS